MAAAEGASAQAVEAGPRKTIRAYKTAVFAIHNPSRHKRALLDDALRRNHVAYTKLLKQLLPRLDEFREFKAGKSRESAIYKVANPVVLPLPLAIGAKAGLISDVAGQISSHIELASHQEDVSSPTAARLKVTTAEWQETLGRLASAITLEEENSARDELFRELREGSVRPVLYLKNRVADGYLLLQHPETGRLLVWLNLHPAMSRFAAPVKVEGLADLRTGELVKFTSRTGALFPLEFGRKHQELRFLKSGRPQSAKLVRRGDCYEVHVSFDYETPCHEITTWLGVDRGIYNLASLAVISGDGTVIEQVNVDGRQLRHVQRQHERRQQKAQRSGRRYSGRSRRSMADEAVHVAANTIVDLASRHGSQVVLENLSGLTFRGAKRTRSNFNRVLNRMQMAKLHAVLDYKLPVVGLPKPKTVSAAWTSQTCPNCGHQDKANRAKAPDPTGDGFILDRFGCVSCGYGDDADLNAARIIGMKKLWRDGLPAAQKSKLMSELTEDHSFRIFLRDRAERRGAARDGGSERANSTSGGRDAAAGPDQRPLLGADNPAAAQHPAGPRLSDQAVGGQLFERNPASISDRYRR